jgi:spermidine synthase
MNRGTARVAALLFCSGACALAYQTTWLRQFRLIFGASTSATAAVLAIFMGGLGAGSAILGKRADTAAKPLAFYGKLEILIAASAALSQPLLFVVSRIYFALGGSTTLGIFGATIVRLILSALVLGLPTFLMGGTLAAAARAVPQDQSRRNVAVLYGTNTLGAVFGTLIATFYLLEHLGNRMTLFVAVGVNVVVGISAILMEDRRPRLSEEEGQVRAPVLQSFALISATVVGFAFLLMELVWYRMLGPLLGGTTFMFGLILATALLGIGLGGAAYAFRGNNSQATIGGFALTCTLEALAIIIPFALGDRLAIIANLIRPLGHIGFAGHVVGWCAMTLIVVFPAAFIAGIQFPLLIALLGSGSERVGRHVGLAYAFNTAGAILGSLAGGFGLMPLLGATGCWMLAAFLLIVLGAVAVFIALRTGQRQMAIAASLAALFAICGTFALGPTAVWRHSGIGAGRATEPKSRREVRAWVNTMRRTLEWDADGRESSIALTNGDDYAFIVNGKADGSARGDAGTQVMSGILQATIHPNPRSAFVIGLGTGSTAGWLGVVPSIERVDVVELEPVVLRIARDMTPVNQNVLANPKVHIQIADAREVLLASRNKYDLIFSEPSNPYRAGIASLFTREYYEAVASRLSPGGVFTQWVQTYDVDGGTVGTIYRTLLTVFPFVETWRGDAGDLLLVASREPLIYDANLIRARLERSPWRDAVHDAWHTEGIEGFFSHYVARDTVGRAIAANATSINTDDKTVIEFGFARGLGEESTFKADQIIDLANRRREFAPARVRGSINWNGVLLQRASDISVGSESLPFPLPDFAVRRKFAEAMDALNIGTAHEIWKTSRFAPLNSSELRSIGLALAEDGDELAAAAAERLRPWNDAEAEAILGQLRATQHRYAEALPHVKRAFEEYRTNPWADLVTMGRLFDTAVAIARADRTTARELFDAVDKPFAAGQWEDGRKYYRVFVAEAIEPCGPAMLRALAELEPYPHWRENVLHARFDCYSRRRLPELKADAERDWKEWLATTPKPLAK